MSSRCYPLFRQGNPQLRIFLPDFWMKIIRHKEPMPQNYVLFQTSVQMTDRDVKNYLEKIYKVPVVEVRTTIKPGKLRKAYGKNYVVQEEVYKEALVILDRHQKFEFPEIAPDEDELQKKYDIENKTDDIDKKKVKYPGVPSWFV